MWLSVTGCLTTKPPRKRRIAAIKSGRAPAVAAIPPPKTRGLQLEFTVEDAGAFTTPWKATITYLRAGTRTGRNVFVPKMCSTTIPERTTTPTTTPRIPTADKPDF